LYTFRLSPSPLPPTQPPLLPGCQVESASSHCIKQYQIRINSSFSSPWIIYKNLKMSDRVVKYDRHRFDDIFYAFTQLFLHRNFVDVCWTKEFYETNFERVSAFPIEIVRPYAERLLRVHGSGPLLHTIIAANLECEPMPTNTGPFSFVVHNKRHEYTFKKDVIGLIAAFGVDKYSAISSDYYCIRCETSVRISGLNLYDSLRQHARDCEMEIDDRYLEPLTW